MRKILLGFVILLVLLLVAIQFFQPEKNVNNLDSGNILQTENVPEEIADILKNACFDCHSDNTKYLWYHKPAPISWMVNRHIIDGKDELNLSEWGEFDIFDKIGTLEEICQETKRKSMPLKSYSLMHPKAKLSEEQIAVLCEWTTKLSEQLLADAIKE